MDNICPFIPKISKSFDLNDNKKETSEEFYNRLYQPKKYHSPITIKRDNFGRIKFNELRDKKTNQLLFKPKINRGPKNINQRNNYLDFNNLYDQRLLSEMNKEKEKELNIKKINKKEYLEQTLNMIIQSKLERYKKIFDSLDSDNDGFISSKNIRLSALDNDKLKNFTPIFEELQQSNIQMNFQDFSKKLDKLTEKKCKEINYFNLDSDDEYKNFILNIKNYIFYYITITLNK
jgi:hypothetical protein